MGRKCRQLYLNNSKKIIIFQKERERVEDLKGDWKAQCQKLVLLISAHVLLAKTQPHDNILKVRCVKGMDFG